MGWNQVKNQSNLNINGFLRLYLDWNQSVLETHLLLSLIIAANNVHAKSGASLRRKGGASYWQVTKLMAIPYQTLGVFTDIFIIVTYWRNGRVVILVKNLVEGAKINILSCIFRLFWYYHSILLNVLVDLTLVLLRNMGLIVGTWQASICGRQKVWSQMFEFLHNRVWTLIFT